ncbi:MAG: hypothetical protein AAGD28_08430, partial [Bacteroidota bacterium]
MNKLLPFLFLFFLCTLSYGQYVGLDWGYALDNQQYSSGISIVSDPSGNAFIAGIYEGNLDMDPGPGTSIANSGSGFASLFIKKMDPNGNYLWGHSFDLGLFADSLSGKNIALDGSGNVYFTGLFNGTVDFDPGPNTFSLTAVNTDWGDFFVLKLDTNGDFVWAKSFGGNDYLQRANVDVDGVGNAFLTGYFYGIVDFDPGPASFPLDGGTSGKVFIQKLDNNGDFLWAKTVGNNNYNRVGGAKVDAQGNLLLCGTFSGILDLDPGTSTFNIGSNNNIQEIFVLKLDGAGDFVWGGNAKEGGSSWRTSMDVDAAGNVYLSGGFRGSGDFDPGNGVFTMNSSNNGNTTDGFLLKLNDQGIFQWAKQMGADPSVGNNADINPHFIRTDQQGQVYSAGYFQGSIDLDPGPGTNILTAASWSSYYFAKYTDAGDLVWALDMNSNNYELIRDISLGPVDNIYVTGGFYQSLDIDPGQGSFTLTSNGNTSMFAFKWTQDSCSNLAAIIDSVADVSCGGTGFASGYALGGTAPYSYTWNNTPASTDTFANFTTAGTYEFTVTDASGCSRTSNILVNGPSSQNGQDLVVNITSTQFRTGF